MKKLLVTPIIVLLALTSTFGQQEQEINKDAIYQAATRKVALEVRRRGFYTDISSFNGQGTVWINEQSYSSRAWNVKEYKVSMTITYLDRQGRTYKTDLNIKVGEDENGRFHAFDIVWGRFL